MKRTPLVRRTPLARGTKPLRRTPIAQRSRKRIAELPQRLAVIAEVEARSGRRCLLAGVPLLSLPDCGGTLDAHEVIPRSAWPGGHLVADNVVLVCRRHHEWIGDHPDLAHALGLHGYSWERPGAAA